MNRIIAAAVLAAVAALPAAAQGVDTIPLERIVAVVGDEPITFMEVRERIIQRRQRGEIGDIPQDPAALRALELETLRELVDEELILSKGRELKVEVLDAEITPTVDAQVQQVRSQFPSEAQFRAELARAGLGTPEEYRRYLLDQLRRNELLQRTIRRLREDGKIIAPNITEAQVAESFERNRRALPPRPPSVTWRQVVINPPASPAARELARQRAESLLAQIRRGAEFQVVARRESMDEQTRETGGDLGWQRRGYYVPEFDRWLFGAFALSPGQISPVVETPFGFHIIRLERTQPGEARARHILVRPTVDSAQVAAARARADSVAQQLRAGTPFDTLARRHHDYANREETSLLNPFPRDSLPEAYRNAFAGKAAGDIVTFQIAGPHDVPKFVVAQIAAADPGGERTLAEMRELIRDRLAQEGGIRRYLDALRREMYVSVRLTASEGGDSE